MADMEATSTLRHYYLVDNSSTAVSTTLKQAAASVFCSDVRNSSLGFYHPDSMTIPSDNYTATTTYESGLPAATTVAAAAELPPTDATHETDGCRCTSFIRPIHVHVGGTCCVVKLL